MIRYLKNFLRGVNWQHKRLLWLVISVLILVTDQYTKALALQLLHYNKPLTVISGWFEFRLLFNTGAAFSLLANAGNWTHVFFVTLTMIICVLLLLWLWTGRELHKKMCLALTLITGGALGNLMDRLYHGHVVDFIQLHYHHLYYYPAFNIADSAITIGALLLLYDSFTGADHAQNETKNSKSS